MNLNPLGGANHFPAPNGHRDLEPGGPQPSSLHRWSIETLATLNPYTMMHGFALLGIGLGIQEVVNGWRESDYRLVVRGLTFIALCCACSYMAESYERLKEDTNLGLAQFQELRERFQVLRTQYDVLYERVRQVQERTSVVEELGAQIGEVVAQLTGKGPDNMEEQLKSLKLL